MKNIIRRLLQKLLSLLKIPIIDERCSPSTKATQIALYHSYRRSYEASLRLPNLNETGMRVFSQFEEDGLLLYIFSIMGMGKKLFVDIGSADGILSNCANLAINWGWHGLFIDGSADNVKKGIEFYRNHPDTLIYPPIFVCEYIKMENINDIIRNNGFEGEVDLLSIDIDGNDYWVWKALDIINPKVVIIETHIELGKEPIVVPYDPNYIHPGKHPHYFGASPMAMEKLAREKGYRLVGSNGYGFNNIYIKNGLVENIFPEVSIDSTLSHPGYSKWSKAVEPIRDWEFVRV